MHIESLQPILDPDTLLVRVTMDDGEEYARTFRAWNAEDRRALRIASAHFGRANRIAALDPGATQALITEHVLGVEAAFPALRHDLRLPV
jgi:hypothetical protein